MRILIVDDSKTARAMCRRVLPPGLRNDLVEAAGGAEALALCRAEAIDLMFLDLTMPDVDGYQVLETLKEEGRARPRVIVMSADIQPEALQRVRALGAVACFPKPANAAAVSKFLEELGIL
jgi:two-component system chemotaxis response regulator CheY